MQVPCSANLMELHTRQGTAIAAVGISVPYSPAVKCVAALSLLSLNQSFAKLGLSTNALRNVTCSLRARQRFAQTQTRTKDAEEDEEEEEEVDEVGVSEEDDSDEDFSDDSFSDDELLSDNSESETGTTASSQEGQIQTPKLSRERVSWKSIFPVLSQKERKELRGHAHRLGKDIVLQHIGKAGVTPNTITCLSDALEKNELMKVKVLNNCPEELNQIVEELEDGLEAQVVGKVGHVLVLYRPSLRKAEKEEKKLEMARMLRKKRFTRQRRR